MPAQKLKHPHGHRLWLSLRLSLSLCLSLILSSTFAQNLVPNPSFETYTSCPVFFAQPGDPLECQPWLSPTFGTSDYFNACATQFIDVPDNTLGYQYARTGEGYGGSIYKAFGPIEYCEYLQTQLLSPLEANTYYRVTFYVSLSNATCGIEHIGAYLSSFAPTSNNGEHLPVTPQIESNMGFLSDTLNWMEISACFLAAGGEQYITIGNFNSQADTPLDPNCNDAFSYYYIDDVSVEESIIEELPFDLGGPVTECFSYTIDPGIPNANYIWSNGYTSSVLTVFVSGTYAVTITQGCLIGEDSIDVTILGNTPPTLGPDMTLCAGETLTIELDPELSEYTWQDGSHESEYTISGPGLYAVTLDEGCGPQTDEILIQYLDPPAPFSLGEDTTLCEGNEIEYSFDPDLGDFEWSDGSDDPTLTIDDPGTYSLIISNACGMASDEIEVSELSEPDAELGPDYLLLCEGQSITIALDPDMGEFVWQDGSMDAAYTITTDGEYSVTVTNICGMSSDEILVDMQFEPILDLGLDLIICPAALPVLLDAGTTVHATDFIWQDGSFESTYEVTGSGIYYVTASNTCFAVTDSIEVAVENVTPVVTLPPDIILCPGETLTLNTNGAHGVNQWQDGSTQDTFLITMAGAYFVDVTNACGTGSDTIEVSFHAPLPVPDLGPDFNLCPGEEAVLSLSITGVSFLWNDMSTADTLLITGAGQYIVEIEDACMSASDTIVVTVNSDPPVLNLPDQLTLCQGDTLQLESNIMGVNYLWNDGSSASSLLITFPGAYSLTVSTPCGANADTVNILDGGPDPLIDLGDDIFICEGDTIELMPTYSDVEMWNWSDGSTGSTIAIDGAGVVAVQVSNGCGVASDTMMAEVILKVPPVSLGTDTAICPGSVIIVDIDSLDFNILWSDGSMGSDFEIQAPGLYHITISNACGVSSDTIQITGLPDAPKLNLGPDLSLCPGESITIDPGISFADYLWQDGSTTPSFTAAQPGMIILTLSNACGSDTDTMLITESTEGPQIDLGPDITACDGSTVTLEAGITGVSFLWSDGSSSPTFHTHNPGPYILIVSNLCGSDADTIDVSFEFAPAPFSLGEDSTLCAGQVLMLQVPQGAANWHWHDGSDQTTFAVTETGTFSLTLENQCGSSADSIAVAFIEQALSLDFPATILWCAGDVISLDASQLFDVDYIWSTGSDLPVIDIVIPGFYTISITGECATLIDEVEVMVDASCRPDPTFYIPNVFSPDGDGINDVFEVFSSSGTPILTQQGVIFDRWGNQVFSSNQNPFRWDGFFHQKAVLPGVYAYIITIVYLDQGEERTRVWQGDVTVVR